ncbi:hypothetical protein OF83DRAFT_287905 [Amylostereum chailletii]|nr:hypothetical protein OF83DRAFT_287905 [Amylostereum chailletii]
MRSWRLQLSRVLDYSQWSCCLSPMEGAPPQTVYAPAEDGRKKQERAPFLTGAALNAGQAGHEQGAMRARLNGTGHVVPTASRTPELRVSDREPFPVGRPSLPPRQAAFSDPMGATTSFNVSQNGITSRTPRPSPPSHSHSSYPELIDSHIASR